MEQLSCNPRYIIQLELLSNSIPSLAPEDYASIHSRPNCVNNIGDECFAGERHLRID